MATLTIQITTGAGTTTSSKTFSSADSQRILAAYQKKIKAAATQQDMNDYLMTSALVFLKGIVSQSETTTPAAPTFT